MGDLVKTDYTRRAIALAAGSDSPAAGPFDGLVVRLYQNDYDPVPGADTASFSECDFPGYAASGAVTWNTPVESGDDTALLIGDNKIFTSSSDSITNTVHGWFGTNTAGDTVICAQRFETPIYVTEQYDYAMVTPTIPFT